MLRRLFNAYRIYLNATAAAKEDIEIAKKKAVEKIAAETEKECEGIVNRARREAEQAQEALFKEAYDKGFNSGVASGQEQGRQKGFSAVLERFGYSVPEHDIPDLIKKQIYVGETARNWANIYDTGTHYVTRVLIAGERHTESFYYKSTPKYRRLRNRRTSTLMHEANQKEKTDALFKAVREVLSYASPADIYVRAVDDVIRIRGIQNPDQATFDFNTMVELAIEFHRYVMASPERGQQIPTWVGDCPVASVRSVDAATARLLGRRWSTLFGKISSRMMDGFYLAGLGHAGTQSERTVRDLLLLTPEDLEDVDGLGAVTVNKIQRDLRTNFGLHLWGTSQRVATQDANTTQAGRNYRVIDLGGDDG